MGGTALGDDSSTCGGKKSGTLRMRGAVGLLRESVRVDEYTGTGETGEPFLFFFCLCAQKSQEHCGCRTAFPGGSTKMGVCVSMLVGASMQSGESKPWTLAREAGWSGGGGNGNVI